MIQASTVGACIWIVLWLLITACLFSADDERKKRNSTKLQYSKREVLFRTILLIVSFLPVFLFARFFELWEATSSDVEQSIKLLTVISSLLAPLAVGGTAAYVAYQQYKLNQALMEIQKDRELRDYIEKTTGLRRPPQ